ncbi:MAG: DUF2203 domain-containing protein [Aquificae bacterium]|nr:DUF2203 domain-containing protein [Aquificota bacterium]
MKYFTIYEANNILPQIKLLVDEIKEKREKLYEIIDKYETYVEMVDEQNDKDKLEIMLLKTEIKTLNEDINELIEIIESFGATVKGIDPFLIDFPAEHNGMPIYLCWKEGEEKIEYWHGIHEGFAGRKHISELGKNIKKV